MTTERAEWLPGFSGPEPRLRAILATSYQYWYEAYWYEAAEAPTHRRPAVSRTPGVSHPRPADIIPGMPDPVLIVGAGPAGLATAAELTRCGVAYRLVERGPTAAHSWEHTYDSLTLHTGKHMSMLPGRRFPRSTPIFPSRADFLAYLRDYIHRFTLDVETGLEVRDIRRDGDDWVAHANGTEVRSPVLVMATGIMAKPVAPAVPGREGYGGLVMHSVQYRRPAPFIGKRVLVVGVGNSGGEIASEIARAGGRVTVLVRSGANVVPRELAGIPIQYLAAALRRLPRGARLWIAERVRALSERRRGPAVLPRPPWSALDAIPLIGFHLVDAIRLGIVRVKLGALDSFTATGVRYGDGEEADFDTVIFATGFLPAIDALGTLVRRDERGFALRSDRVASADQPGLYFVGHNYDVTGGLANIRKDATIVARRLAETEAVRRRR
jgi:cation diffusion facilitator CzcD-associated flavoprotein CzcO